MSGANTNPPTAPDARPSTAAKSRSSDPTARAEQERSAAERARWRRFGPYLAERQWGTVREDYSTQGESWSHFPHDHARSRVYRWGEDGLLGICDDQGLLCFALALWNGRDPILKERLFGLTGPEGNHGEDVKELYYYLDGVPDHTYLRALYKYPQAEFPYARLVEENRRRGKDVPEYELLDTGVFAGDRYFDVDVRYAKVSPDDVLVRIEVANRGPDPAPLHVLPTLWCRNTWSWQEGDSTARRPQLRSVDDRTIEVEHPELGTFLLFADVPPGGSPPELVFTDNETNLSLLYGRPGPRYTKDAFHRWLIDGQADAINPEQRGTKAAVVYRIELAPGASMVLQLRLRARGAASTEPFGVDFAETFADRLAEADALYAEIGPPELNDQERVVQRQAYASLLWTEQLYEYDVARWFAGDPAQPPPPGERLGGRNRDWRHVRCRDIISMPDKWEYPWFAAWDSAFHAVAFAKLDPVFARQQLLLLLDERYMHPNGQLPAYEFNFSDVNPPVHAWAVWCVYKMADGEGSRDRGFLRRAFHKLLLNFTWWVNRKDREGKHLFSGGFLGLDNIGVFDRSHALPTGGYLQQADGTAWMAFYCAQMLLMATELAQEEPAYEDMAWKFFVHFIAIHDATNALGGEGLWHEGDGFYYDQIQLPSERIVLPVRSMVGLIPLLAVDLLDETSLERLPTFRRRVRDLLEQRRDLGQWLTTMAEPTHGQHRHRLLALPSKERLLRMLRYLLDENEFLSPFGIRSLSKVHAAHPFVFHLDGQEHRVDYAPGESTSYMFGGNSNWRGPVWLPMNFLLVEALERYHDYYRDSLMVECPTGSGQYRTLAEVAHELALRVERLFLPGTGGRRPCHGEEMRYAADPHFRDLVLFYEYFHAETGQGLGASHQTGWTALVALFLEELKRRIRTST